MELGQPLQRILLIDDNPNDRLLATRELHQEFPTVAIDEVLDEATLHQALDCNNFDLAITDYELNWSTGLEVLRAIKAIDPNRPVIMFTNSGTQEVAVEAMKAGLEDYVLKSPKHFLRLSQSVRSVWETAQIRQRVSELDLRLKFLLNQLKVGVFRVTLDGQLLEVSDGLLHLLNLRSRSAAQQFFQEQLAYEAVDRMGMAQWQREFQTVGADDCLRWFQISETLVRSNGKTVIDGLVSDITEQKQTAAVLQSLNQSLEQRVQERTARLNALNRELELFAFSVSHDLRSPIRQIDGFVNLLGQQLATTTDDTVCHYLQLISELTDRAGRMIDDLLQFSRTGRAEMHYTTVSMERLVQEVKRLVEISVPDRTIQWKINTLPKVYGDRHLLGQVWQNLIENAVKYTRIRAQATIEIGSQTTAAEIIFFVRDNGIGFDMNDAQRLFGIFQRLPNAEVFEGTGIGLANALRTVTRHGGRLWAEGMIDVGATFYFSLPIVPEASIAGVDPKQRTEGEGQG